MKGSFEMFRFKGSFEMFLFRSSFELFLLKGFLWGNPGVRANFHGLRFATNTGVLNLGQSTTEVADRLHGGFRV